MGKFKNLLSAKISGNVGSMNFRQRGSEVVVAERAYENKSAGTGATEAQRVHRSRLANLVDFFRCIRAIEARAWEGKKPYISDFNMLTKINLASSPVFLTKQEAELKASVVAPYIVSRGSLPSLQQRYNGTNFLCGVKVSSEFDFALATIGEVSRSILALNVDWKDGDKLSICCIDQVQETVSGVVIPVAKVRYIEFTINSASTDLIDTIPGFVALEFDHDTEGELICNLGGDAGFAIHSRKSSGYLETSEQQIIMKSLLHPIYLQYTSEAQKRLAMDSYGYQGEVLLTPFSEDEGKVSYPATVDSIMFNGAALTNGAVLTAAGSLIITGEGMTKANVVLSNNGTKYTPLTDTLTEQGYTLTSNGTYTLTVNGVLALSFTIDRGEIIQQIKSFKLGTKTYTSKQDNLTMEADSQIAVEVNGTDLGAITATNATVTGNAGDETHRTATVTFNVAQNSYAILVGGEIIAAGRINVEW